MSSIDFSAIPSPRIELTVRPRKRDLRLSIDGKGHLLKGIKAATVINAIAENRERDTVRHWEVGKYRVEVTTYLNPYSGTVKTKAAVAFDYKAPLYDLVEGERVETGTMEGVKTIQAPVVVED